MEASSTSGRRRGAGCVCALALIVAALGFEPVRAQEDIWVPEIRLTENAGTHARALGMGGAYLALSEDLGALRHNVAGLARVKRLEFSGSLTDLERELTTTYEGVGVRSSLGRTRVTALGFVYPFPVYRGSMVLAVGYNAPYLFDRDYQRRNRVSADDAATLEQLFEEGQVGEWSAGLAFDVTPTLSVGVRGSYIQGAREQDWVYRDANFDIHDVTAVDYSGLTASLGAMSRLGHWGRLGMVLDLPRWIWIEGTVTDVVYDERYAIDDEMTLPFSAGFGISATFARLLLAADARYTDWTQIDYAGPLRYDTGERRELAYDRVWDLHLGAEYLADWIPSLGLRLRAGVAYEPVPYRVLLEEIEVDAEGYAVPIYRPAEYDPDRLSWTAGIGLLLEDSLTLDLAYVQGGYERTGLDLAEEESLRRLLLTASFRLE